MRAGNLDKTITIKRCTETFDDYSVPTEALPPIVTMKAQIVQANTAEVLKGYRGPVRPPWSSGHATSTT